jgi:hypothetical protein
MTTPRRDIVSALVLACAGALACNVTPTAHDHCDAKLERTPGCPAGALVVMSDFESTQIALATLDGLTLCSSLISSARTETTAVTFALSGDVVLPSSRPASGRAVLIDRYGTNVVSFVNPTTGAIESQLAAGTGFEANIQDYVEIDETRALVSRWNDNPVPGQEPFDDGGDLLLIDTKAPTILGNIVLPRDDAWPPRPAGLTRVGDEAWVTLQRFSQDIQSEADGEIVGVSLADLTVAWTLPLTGLKDCGPPTLAPDGDLAAVACSGFVDRNGAVESIDESAVVVLDLGTSPPTESARFAASDVDGEPLQADLEFFAEHRVLVNTQTALHAASNNRVLALDLDGSADAAVTLLEARPGDDGGQGVVYGGMLCTPGCADQCLVADADRAVIARFALGGAEPVPETPLPVSGSVGLPPRDVGGF